MSPTDERIYYACERIRLFCFTRAGKQVLTSKSVSELNEHPGAKKIIAAVHKGSLIHSLISKNDWKSLFENEEWLSLLDMAQNLNSLEEGTVTEQLKTLAELFPEETRTYIFTEIL